MRFFREYFFGRCPVMRLLDIPSWSAGIPFKFQDSFNFLKRRKTPLQYGEMPKTVFRKVLPVEGEEGRNLQPKKNEDGHLLLIRRPRLSVGRSLRPFCLAAAAPPHSTLRKEGRGVRHGL